MEKPTIKIGGLLLNILPIYVAGVTSKWLDLVKVNAIEL